MVVRAWVASGRAALAEIKFTSCTLALATHAVSGGGLADSPEARRSVWLFQLVGDFELHRHFGPPGMAAPTGRFLHLVVDQEAHEMLSRGVGDREVDLAGLGDVAVPRPQATN
jgi:hypothetical protein